MNGKDATRRGPQLLINMMELLQDLFKWDKNLKFLLAAADIARVEKANAYQRAKTCQDILLEMTHS